ncbi:MAG: hypothetical protein A3208_04515 [Candidatus Methanoprimaticola hominis]|nr:MAG: hypothetical protein A3208_04515 [Methanomassiliicoccales archaeon Mx-06]
MRLRLPPFGTIITPEPEDGGVASLDPFPSTPQGSKVATIDPSSPLLGTPRPKDRTLPELFGAIACEDVRTKPSYTDCWVAGTPELRTIASYMTQDAAVTIGESAGGEAYYCVTPREYAYPDPLNLEVLELIEDIRESYRERGGSLDRDSIEGMARSILSDRWDDIAEASGTDDVESVVRDICSIAYRHSVGAGIFEVLLSDQHIEDVYVDAPCSSNRIHVTVNGIEGLNSHIRCSTNLMAEEREVDNLVNILRRRSGLRFCASSPVLETDLGGFDARATIVGYPLSPHGNAVAIRKHSVRPWTLSRLISNGTVSPRIAGIISFLINSRATMLICGARGAGKTSLLSAALMEFPLNQRILTIEDTLEIQGDYMRRMGYKVQTMLVDDRIQGTANSRADEALRTSLRLGESAIVMGEVRGEEAKTLYQSMRAGRAGSAILGTVHGDSASSVYQRMVYDVGIPPEAFMATDVIVTLGTVRDRRTGNLIRRVNEMVCTGRTPGEFIDISGPEGLLSSPFMERALQSLQMTRKDAVKDMRARSMMRSYLAGEGMRDQSYLGPEWILTANEILEGMKPGSSAEDALRELKRRVEGDARRQEARQRGSVGGRSVDLGNRIRGIPGCSGTHGGLGWTSGILKDILGGGPQDRYEGGEEREGCPHDVHGRSAGGDRGIPSSYPAVHIRLRGRGQGREQRGVLGGIRGSSGRGASDGRAVQRFPDRAVHGSLQSLHPRSAGDYDDHPGDGDRRTVRFDGHRRRGAHADNARPDPGGDGRDLHVAAVRQPVPRKRTWNRPPRTAARIVRRSDIHHDGRARKERGGVADDIGDHSRPVHHDPVLRR